ncbi:MAG: hypothetical protein A4E54_01788 [Pelotomaculum sp. PtaB.Bin117]|nr:MAG: hypothetical protein A4E54_01788 [Pelotomaculum sp. PtaB.Bin117]OPY60871.1 MAG: hypothetical protein A4E56_02408 [Pelotomaculum sp. PtaU1.Bin065]
MLIGTDDDILGNKTAVYETNTLKAKEVIPYEKSEEN